MSYQCGINFSQNHISICKHHLALVFGEHESVTKRSNQNWLNGNTTNWRVGFVFCAHFPRGCEIDNNTFITIYWKCHVVISRYMYKVQPMETTDKPKEKVKHQINETVFVQCQYMTAISNESHTRRQIVFTCFDFDVWLNVPI